MRHDDLLWPRRPPLARCSGLDEIRPWSEARGCRDPVKLRCTLGSGLFEGGRGTGPERLAVLRLAFLLRAAFGKGFRRRGSFGFRLKRLSASR